MIPARPPVTAPWPRAESSGPFHIPPPSSLIYKAIPKAGSPCTPWSDRRMGLIIPWSQVRVLAGPPSPMEIIDLWHWDQGIRVPWSESIGGGFPIVAFMRHRNSIDPIDLAKKIAALSPNDDKKPPYVAEYSALIGLNHHMLLLSIELPSDGTKHASNCAN